MRLSQKIPLSERAARTFAVGFISAEAGEVAPTRQDDTSAALMRCSKAFTTAHRNAQKLGKSARESREMGVYAYKLNMPTMTTHDGVVQAIACIVAGMNLDIITGAEGSKLLYAAQVALSALREARR